MARGRLHTCDRWHHRDVRCGVVVLVFDGQRPEVRRSPQEDHRKEHEWLDPKAVGNRSPADQHRHATSRAADDDVLRRRSLEPQGVNEDVDPRGSEGQHRREWVDKYRQPYSGDNEQPDREDQRVSRRDLAGDNRATLRSLHDLVDVAIDVHVYGVRSTSCERSADHGCHDQPQARQTSCSHDHRGHRSDEQLHDNPRLRQGHVGRSRRSAGVSARSESRHSRPS